MEKGQNNKLKHVFMPSKPPFGEEIQAPPNFYYLAYLIIINHFLSKNKK